MDGRGAAEECNTTSSIGGERACGDDDSALLLGGGGGTYKSKRYEQVMAVVRARGSRSGERARQ